MKTRFVQCFGFQRSDLTPDAKSTPQRTSLCIGYSSGRDHCEQQEVTVTKTLRTGVLSMSSVVQTGHSFFKFTYFIIKKIFSCTSRHVGPQQFPNHTPCIGRWSLNRQTTRKVPRLGIHSLRLPNRRHSFTQRTFLEPYLSQRIEESIQQMKLTAPHSAEETQTINKLRKQDRSIEWTHCQLFLSPSRTKDKMITSLEQTNFVLCLHSQDSLGTGNARLYKPYHVYNLICSKLDKFSVKVESLLKTSVADFF